MTGRATLLPVAMVVVIVVLALIAISSGRSNAPDVAGDSRYPHYVCTFTEYCAGSVCTREPESFVLYLAHEDGNARIEWPYVNPRSFLTETDTVKLWDTSGGQVSGRFSVNSRRGVNFVGALSEDETEAHYGAGQCERLRTP